MNIITKEDLAQFKSELMKELRRLLTEEEPVEKKWLKSHEVIEMLGISRGTLQHLREKGTLKATKIGGLMYYEYEDIKKMMKSPKRH